MPVWTHLIIQYMYLYDDADRSWCKLFREVPYFRWLSLSQRTSHKQSVCANRACINLLLFNAQVPTCARVPPPWLTWTHTNLTSAFCVNRCASSSLIRACATWSSAEGSVNKMFRAYDYYTAQRDQVAGNQLVCRHLLIITIIRREFRFYMALATDKDTQSNTK